MKTGSAHETNYVKKEKNETAGVARGRGEGGGADNGAQTEPKEKKRGEKVDCAPASCWRSDVRPQVSLARADSPPLHHHACNHLHRGASRSVARPHNTERRPLMRKGRERAKAKATPAANPPTTTRRLRLAERGRGEGGGEGAVSPCRNVPTAMICPAGWKRPGGECAGGGRLWARWIGREHMARHDHVKG